MAYSAIIFTHSITPRLRYIADFLSEYYGQSFRLTADEESYAHADIPCRINYSYHRVRPGETWIHSHVLLFESSVRPVKVECFSYHDYTAFFKTEGDFGFDLLAGIFYLLSRYEEYLPHPSDSYGRYAHTASVAHREGFLHLPLVNTWLEDFRKLLAAQCPAFAKPVQQFSWLPTYDIDMAWSYRNKGFLRNAGALAAHFFRGEWKSLGRRIAVLRGKKKDPYDAYEWMDRLHADLRLQPQYFFLVALHRGQYDKNIAPTHPGFRELVHAIAGRHAVGLHPSWGSGDHPSQLLKEKACLQEMSGKKITQSRQHYIRFSLPLTYRRLLDAGIREDFSMGYGSINGFRASITTPFYWYDLKAEEATTLRLRPFCFMDANSFYEQAQDAEAAAAEMLSYYERVKAVRGEFITIWHNSFLGTDPQFEGWKEKYRELATVIMC